MSVHVQDCHPGVGHQAGHECQEHQNAVLHEVHGHSKVALSLVGETRVKDDHNHNGAKEQHEAQEDTPIRRVAVGVDHYVAVSQVF